MSTSITELSLGTTPPPAATASGHRETLLHGGGISLRTRDLERAIGFYCRALGLELRLRVGGHWAEVRCDSLTIGLLHDPEAAAGGSEAEPEIGFDVASLAPSMAALRERGVIFAPVVSDSGGAVRVARFRDPDGHRLYLCEVVRGPGRPPFAGSR